MVCGDVVIFCGQPIILTVITIKQLSKKKLAIAYISLYVSVAHVEIHVKSKMTGQDY